MREQRVLVIAPHNDDEVLGVGGTIKKMSDEGNDVYVCEVTKGIHFNEIQKEARKAHRILGVKETFFLDQPVCMLKTTPQLELNSKISEIIKYIEPTMVFIPFIGDMHVDHREVTESAMVALRPIGEYSVGEIYMYETLSETGWNLPTFDRTFVPNTWIDITEFFSTKIDAMACYKSQLFEYPHPRSKKAIKALAQYRGSTIGVCYAESFMLVRKVMR